MPLQISIRDEKPAEPQPVMELWLERDGDTVILLGSDSDGDSWIIARIFPDGIRFAANIAAPGWPLDEQGRLKFTK